MFARLAEGFAAGQKEEVGIGRRNDDFLPVHFLFQHFRKPDLRRHAEGFTERAAAQITVNQKGARAGEGHRNCEVGRDCRFAFVRHRAGDEHRLRPRTLIRHEENRGANVAIRFRENVARVVRLQQSDASLGFLFRNLSENVLREMVLEFAERRHPVVDPIEEQQNGDAGKRARAKTDEQAL